MSDHKCANCGAPLSTDLHLCGYCQSPNPYYIAPEAPQPQMDYNPSSVVRPARPSFSMPSFLPSFSWLNVGTFLIFGGGLAAIAYAWVQVDEQQKQEGAAAAVRAESNRTLWVAEHTGWQYKTELNSDSLVENRFATLSCSESLVNVPVDSDVRESRNITIGMMYLGATSDNIVSVGLPYNNPPLKPWEYKGKTFVKLAFDGDTAARWYVNDLVSSDHIFIIKESKKALAKLKKSKRLRLEMPSAAVPDSIVKLSFETDGLKW